MAAKPTPWSLRLLAGGTVLASVIFLVLGDGHPGAALAPALLLALGVALVRAPFAAVATGVVFLALLVDDVRARPHMGHWRSPLFAPGRFVYDGLDKITGVPGLKIFGVELLFVLLAVLLVLTLLGTRHRLRRPPPPFTRAALVAIAAVLLLEAWGLARGGTLRFSMLQMRPMRLTGLASLVLAYAAPTAGHARALLGAVVAAANLRAVVGVYYWIAVQRGLGHELGLWLGRGAPSPAAWAWALAAAALATYVLRGLQLSGLGWRGVRALAHAPPYIAWKLLVVRGRGASGKGPWVRTRRSAEDPPRRG